LVAASGSGLEALHAEKAAHGLDNLKIIGLVPFEQYPEVLASADVLCSVIERDAGVYSVPSKVLSYLCAGRPILLAAPAENLAAKTVAGHRAGLVVDPEDQAAFLSAADALYRDDAMRAVMGRAGRAYAERHFPLPRIADQFEAMIAQTGFTPPGPEPVKS
jgi:glycosyltransferase involved in cell wall biosynthesis